MIPPSAPGMASHGIARHCTASLGIARHRSASHGECCARLTIATSRVNALQWRPHVHARAGLCVRACVFVHMCGVVWCGLVWCATPQRVRFGRTHEVALAICGRACRRDPAGRNTYRAGRATPAVSTAVPQLRWRMHSRSNGESVAIARCAQAERVPTYPPPHMNSPPDSVSAAVWKPPQLTATTCRRCRQHSA